MLRKMVCAGFVVALTVSIAAADIDHLAATLQYKVSRGKVYLT